MLSIHQEKRSLQNAAFKRGATELNTEGNVMRMSGVENFIGAAARQRMSALQDLQESSRIPAESKTGAKAEGNLSLCGDMIIKLHGRTLD